ncbi:MAG: threonylcarbamoyl-AMP synthase [Muribaculaceae bacterium]|nr:threonylcarbamoyl-AMP synthase [Muribaculaceae bacterium]
MKTLKIYGNAVNGRYIEQAVEALREGGVIVYPTDTLYAIGCDALNNRAIERICRIKDIDPRRQHLSITCADLSQAARYARIDNNAFDLMRRNLPGPFTFILPASTNLPKVFKGRKEVGIRVPDDPVAHALAEALGNPLLTTSIYLEDINADMSDIASLEIAESYASDITMVIDAGPRDVIGSTVVDLSDSSSPEIIREGRQSLNL